jgi:hypothetical protein
VVTSRIEAAMVEDRIARAEAEAINVGAAHLLGELGEPRTGQEARLLVSVAMTAAATMAARHIVLAGIDEVSAGKLARYWGDEFVKLIERTIASLPEHQARQDAPVRELARVL